ncbi:MAG: hypothetical protein CL600_02955 [Alteromonas sp.]|jgi:hypothetical protein|uniref:hypothetical protein n=1 Tax=unclassified Alteromonas TaxID=2614992 RepID=UPI000903B23D|nr:MULTISPECIES: hypothetical protein [unclassified Alteromonas]APE04892.1 hypothetical protein BM528_03160 [Alteromonas sp. RW2A1]AUC87294.1 hypothetical protein CW735_03030 [Alteromonas sp. MB-3u-76]MAI63834.1 hypothetical protein [Alteromonas sp.]
MNYKRYFDGKQRLTKQALVNLNTLSAMFRGRSFDLEAVNEYNRWTNRFNRATTRAEQERALDERQRFMLKVIHAPRQAA